MLNSSPVGYRDADILVKETITVVGKGANNAEIAIDKNTQEVIFKTAHHLLTASAK